MATRYKIRLVLERTDPGQPPVVLEQMPSLWSCVTETHLADGKYALKALDAICRLATKVVYGPLLSSSQFIGTVCSTFGLWQEELAANERVRMTRVEPWQSFEPFDDRLSAGTVHYYRGRQLFVGFDPPRSVWVVEIREESQFQPVKTIEGVALMPPRDAYRQACEWIDRAISGKEFSDAARRALNTTSPQAGS